ncbi:MAG TPA: CHRD domain-containing protein [Gaiellaceae bacterium]|jgi:hypothetical protein|nr:CHRD domain-containing protein [Gaiellaceae bacterium]
MKKVIAAVAVAAALVLAAVAFADTYTINTKLTPGADVPKPKGAPNARGTFTGRYVEHQDKATLTWKLTYSGLTGAALQAHIHSGKPGVAGNVIVPLCGPCHSGMTGHARIGEAVIKALESGGAYVNVHTKKNPAGEIRGQIRVAG